MAKKYIHPKYRERTLDRQWPFLLTVLSAPFLVVLGTFTFNIAAPTIQASFHVGVAQLQLMWASYILAYAAFLITGGRLGDLYGKKKIFILGLFLFSLSSSLIAIAPNPAFFIAARILQGLSAALMYPQTLSLIQANFEGKERSFALSVFGVTLGMAAVLAQLLGGFIIQENFFGMTWRPLFLLNLPISATASLLALRLVPRGKMNKEVTLDLGGAGFVAAGLSLFTVPLIMGQELHWPFWSWLALLASLGTSFMFVRYEWRIKRNHRSPLVDFNLFRLPSFVAGLLLTLFFYAGQGSFFFMLTLYLQHGLQYSPLRAGLTFSPLAIGLFFASLFSPRLMALLKEKALLIGSCALILGILFLSFVSLSVARPIPVLFSLPLLLVGIGFGTIIPPLIGFVLKGVPSNYAGAASGVLVTAQQAASSIGIAVVGVVFFRLLGSDMQSHYPRAFGLTLCCNAAFFVASGVLVRLSRRSRVETPANSQTLTSLYRVASPHSRPTSGDVEY